MNAQFLAIAQDPTIIPGVHHHCDEWCDYCPVAARCLEFRCTAAFRRQHRRRDADPTFVSMDEAIGFTRELAALDGSSTEELDALLAKPGGGSGLETTDPLASVAWEYAVGAAFLFTAPPKPHQGKGRRAATPAPEEVVLWHHLRIYMKLVRALVSRSGDDANGCAKLVLVSAAKSRAALMAMREAGQDAVDPLIAALEDLERKVEQRFPLARGYVRAGLDCPVA
jgi:hypothetical protein